MARAGKVRGQTPKVQKQDKKKQPKGRAMKRIKYNRRFVNVGEAPSCDVASSGLAASLAQQMLYTAPLSAHSRAPMHGSAKECWFTQVLLLAS